MATAQDKLAKLQEAAKKTLEKANRKRAEAAALERQIRQKASAQERKDDTRKKVLVGAMYLEHGKKYPDQQERTMKLLSQYLQKTDDRTLFGLPPVPATETSSKEKPAD